MNYRYTVRGRAADGQTWSTRGVIEKKTGDGFEGLLIEAMTASFMKLTRGRAVFGLPGVGCRGPYTVTHFAVEVDDGAGEENRS